MFAKDADGLIAVFGRDYVQAGIFEHGFGETKNRRFIVYHQNGAGGRPSVGRAGSGSGFPQVGIIQGGEEGANHGALPGSAEHLDAAVVGAHNPEHRR